MIVLRLKSDLSKMLQGISGLCKIYFYPVDPVNPVENILDIKLNSAAWARPTLYWSDSVWPSVVTVVRE